MARPARLVKLEKGKFIDVHEGFVDTFNYLVDYIQNLCGEGNLDPAGAVWIDRNRADRPIIRLNVNKLPQGGGGGSVVPLAGEDNGCFAIRYENTGTEEEPVYTPTYLVNCYYARGAVVHDLGGPFSWNSSWNSAVLALKVTADSASLVTYGSVGAMIADTSDPMYTVFPLYSMSSRAVAIDFRKLPTAQMVEVL